MNDRRVVNAFGAAMVGVAVIMFVGYWLLATGTVFVPSDEAAKTVPGPTSTSSTTSTSTTTTLPALEDALLAGATFEPWADEIAIACTWIRQQPGDRFLDRVLDDCDPIARAGYDIYGLDLERVDVGDFERVQYRLDVLHMMYIDSFESAGDPLANGRNWGCPRQEELVGFHPDPDGIGPDGRPNCPYFQNRVPMCQLSHMSHLVVDRSERLFGYLIDPCDLYEAALLGFALVDEIGGNGWFHWWHISWGMNRYTSRHGIRSTWYCPPDAYWANVRGGRQTCPSG